MKRWEHQIREGVVYGITGKVLTIVANIALTMVASRYLSPYELGIYVIQLLIIDFVFGMVNSGVGTPLIAVARFDRGHEQAGLFVCLSCSLIWIVLVLLVAQVTEIQGILPLIVLMPPRILSVVYESILLRNQKIKQYQMIQSISSVLGSVTSIIMIIDGQGVYGIIVGLAAAFWFELIASCLLSDYKLLPKFKHEYIKQIFQMGSGTLTTRLLNYGAVNLDKVIVTMILSMSALGIYSRALSVASLPTKLVGVTLGRIYTSTLSGVNDEDQRRALVDLVLGVQTVLYFTASTVLVVSTPLIIRFFLGPGWQDVNAPAQVLLAVTFARLGYEFCESVLVTNMPVWRVAQRQLVYLIMAFCFSIIGSLFGIYGVAVGASSSILLFYVYSLSQVHKISGFNKNEILRIHIYMVGLFVIEVVICMLIREWALGNMSEEKSSLIQAAFAVITSVAYLAFAKERMVGSAFVSLRKKLRNIRYVR